MTTKEGTKFIFEKNERQLISKTIPKNIEDKLHVAEFSGKSFLEVYNDTKARMGAKFLPYNASSNNCQNFILSILHSQNINKAEYNDLIKQDTSKIFEGKSGLRKVANSTVKVGKVANMLMAGGAVKKSNPWLDHVKKYRQENGGSYVQALKDAKKTYKK